LFSILTFETRHADSKPLGLIPKNERKALVIGNSFQQNYIIGLLFLVCAVL
jgi:hypothetical protein